MDDAITDDQRILVDASARLIADTYPLERVRENAYDDAAFAAGYRRRAGELGWYSLLVPEELGRGQRLRQRRTRRRAGRVSPRPPPAAGAVRRHQRGGLRPGRGRHRAAPCQRLAGADVRGGVRGVGGDRFAGRARGRRRSRQRRPAAAATGLSGSATFVEDPGPGRLVSGHRGGRRRARRNSWYAADDPGLRVEPLGSLDITRRFVALSLDALDVPASARVGKRRRRGAISSIASWPWRAC